MNANKFSTTELYSHAYLFHLFVLFCFNVYFETSSHEYVQDDLELITVAQASLSLQSRTAPLGWALPLSQFQLLHV